MNPLSNFIDRLERDKKQIQTRDNIVKAPSILDDLRDLLSKMSQEFSGIKSAVERWEETYKDRRPDYIPFSEKLKQCRADGTLIDVEDNFMSTRVVLACHKYKTACCLPTRIRR